MRYRNGDPMTNIYVSIGGTDVSSYVFSVDIKREENNLAEFKVLILRDPWSWSFSVGDSVIIKFNNAQLFKGWVSQILTLLDPSGERFYEVNGRGLGEELMFRIFSGMWSDQSHFDLDIKDPLDVECSGYLTLSTSSVGLLAWESKRETFLKKFRDECERLDLNFFVDMDGYVRLYDEDSGYSNLSTSTLVVKARNNDPLNNVLSLENIIDGLDIANYILIEGQEINDGWTEGNSSDWNPVNPHNILLDDIGSINLGKTSIYCKVGNSYYVEGLELGNTSTGFSFYHYNYLDYSNLNEDGEVWINCIFPDTSTNIRVTIWDSDGTTRYRDLGTLEPSTWKNFTFPLGPDSTGWSGTGDFDWLIKKIRFSPASTPSPTSVRITSQANSGQRDVEVSDASVFSVGENVTIWDDTPQAESNAIYDINTMTNVLTMVDPLENTYKQATNNDSLVVKKENSFDMFRLDGLHFPKKNMIGYAFSTSSESLYRRRWKVIKRRDVSSQKALDSLATKLLNRYKEPMKILHVKIIGNEGVVYPGYNIVVDCPDDGIDNSGHSYNYRIRGLRHLYRSMGVYEGYDYITVLDCVKKTTSPSTQYLSIDRYYLRKREGLFRELSKKIKSLELPERVIISGEGSLSGGWVQ